MIIWSRMFLVAVLSKKTHDTGIKKAIRSRIRQSITLAPDGIDDPSKRAFKLTAPFDQPKMAI